MKIPATLYLTDTSRQTFLRASSDEERLTACTIYTSTLDMSDYWTKVGTCEIEVTWLPDSTVRENEVRRIDDQIEKIQLEAGERINRLQEYRSTLLCLTHNPSPSTDGLPAELGEL